MHQIAESGTDLLYEAIRVREELNNLNIGYNNSADCNCLVGPEPFYIATEEADKLEAQAWTLKKWFETSIELLNRSVQDTGLKWLTQLVEGNLPETVVQIHRNAHRQGVVTPPLFARADMVTLGSTVEVQTPGSGWGYQTAIKKLLAEDSRWIGPVEGFRQGVESATGTVQPVCAYIQHNRALYREVEYFCEECRKAGTPLRLSLQSLPNLDEVKLVRRQYLENLLSYNGAEDLLERVIRGELVLEPGPSLLFDQKIATAFPFHPQLCGYYTDEVRDIFPETHLVIPGEHPSFNGETIKWEQFPSVSRSKRQFILKFAGASGSDRAGGKAVYNLSDCSQKQTRELIERALSSWTEHRAPWMIQKRVQEKYPVTFLDHTEQVLRTEDYYANFRPLYLVGALGESPSLIACTALFRKEWKVHGASDAVMLPVEPRTT